MLQRIFSFITWLNEFIWGSLFYFFNESNACFFFSYFCVIKFIWKYSVLFKKHKQVLNYANKTKELPWSNLLEYFSIQTFYIHVTARSSHQIINLFRLPSQPCHSHPTIKPTMEGKKESINIFT